MRRLLFSIITLLILGISCKKKCQGPMSVLVSAGNDQVIALPVDSAILTGVVKSGLTANTAYLWTIISAPNMPSITYNDSTITGIKNLVAGTYVIEFQATNNSGITGYDTTTIVVNTAGVQLLALRPTNNPNEGGSYSYIPDNSTKGDAQLSIMAWTVGGTPATWREYIKFDYTGLSASDNILSAKFYLYAMPVPEGGNNVDAMYGSANACYIQRITSNSPIYSYTWNNLPTTTTVDQAVIPQSISLTENDTIDVTSLVKDMLVNGNNGFALQLQSEVYYNCRQYASSYYSDSTLHPKLIITYKQ